MSAWIRKSMDLICGKILKTNPSTQKDWAIFMTSQLPG